MGKRDTSALVEGADLTGAQKLRVRMSQVVAAVSGGAVDVASAAAAGRVSRTTVYEWLRRAGLGEEPYVTFMQEFDAARQKRIMDLQDRIEGASQVDWRAAGYLLDRTDKFAADPLREAWQQLTEEEQIEAVARNPEVVKRVLALQESKALTEGGGV